MYHFTMAEETHLDRLFGLFRGKIPDFGENANIHEIAREIRDVQLNAIDFGVIGSHHDIPSQASKKASKLPTLLLYSGSIRNHFQTLRGVLSEPREFQIVDQVGQPWRDDVPDGDVIYRMESRNPIYYFTSHLTSPYLNSWAAAIDNLRSGKPFLCIAILQNNESHDGIWEMAYNFTDHNDMTSDNNVSMSNLYPERQMILQFWYSPKRLSAKYLFNNFPCAKVVKEHLSLVGDKENSDFRQIVFHFDGKRYADREEHDHIWRDDLPERYAAFLHKRGDFDFSIVEIGTTTLGGQKHWIYTGSEVARIEERSDQRVPYATRQLVHDYIA